jgi:hypothetical protein
MAVFHHGEPCTFRSTKNIIFGNKKKDDGVLPVLDSLDNYKILSERMNVLTIYLPWGKIGTCIASDLRKVKTAVQYDSKYNTVTLN